jgi:hypothetical protein
LQDDEYLSYDEEEDYTPPSCANLKFLPSEVLDMIGEMVEDSLLPSFICVNKFMLKGYLLYKSENYTIQIDILSQ